MDLFHLNAFHHTNTAIPAVASTTSNESHTSSINNTSTGRSTRNNQQHNPSSNKLVDIVASSHFLLEKSRSSAITTMDEGDHDASASAYHLHKDNNHYNHNNKNQNVVTGKITTDAGPAITYAYTPSTGPASVGSSGRTGDHTNNTGEQHYYPNPLDVSTVMSSSTTGGAGAMDDDGGTPLSTVLSWSSWNPTNVMNNTPTTTTGNNKGILTNSPTHKGEAKPFIVICKSYYVIHSFRYTSLLSKSSKPVELTGLSNKTWQDMQSQMSPLLRRHLFLPKSYLLVPVVVLVAVLGWFVTLSIATGTMTDSMAAAYNKAGTAADNASLAMFWFVWIMLYMFMASMAFLTLGRWMRQRNAPVDEELRWVVEELSRSKTQAEGYRVDYCRTDASMFATRLLRFTPIVDTPSTEVHPPPPMSKIQVPSAAAPAVAATAAPDLLDSTDLEASNTVVESQQPFVPGGVMQLHSQLSTVSEAANTTMTDMSATLQSLSTMIHNKNEYQPFPLTDQRVENVASLLFVLVVAQCVHSLP